MKKFALILMLITMLSIVNLAALETIHDIQYTEDTSNDGPSSFDGDVVEVEGIVTGYGYSTNKYFISDPQGGAWSGLYVYDFTNDPNVGDLVRVKGTIDEYYGFTELTSISSYQLISTGNALPAPTVITTAQAANEEQWESVLVEIRDVTVTQAPDNHNEWYVTDGNASDECQIDDSFGFLPSPINTGDNFAIIRGIVDFSYDYFGINPRGQSDVIRSTDINDLIVVIEASDGMINDIVSASIVVPEILDLWNVSKIELSLAYDSNILRLYNWNTESAVFYDSRYLTVNEETHTIDIVYDSPEIFTGAGSLIDLNFMARSLGTDTLVVTSFVVNETIEITNFAEAIVEISDTDPTVTPIYDIQSDTDYWLGRNVTVMGTVTVEVGVLRTDKINIYIQDGSGRGIQLYGDDITPQLYTDFARGNKVKVTGTVDEYNGTTEITDWESSYQIIAENQPFDHIIETINFEQAADYLAYEGTLVLMNGRITEVGYAGGGANITVADNSGNDITMRVWDSANINTDFIKPGHYVGFAGIIGSYNGTSQIAPAYTEDIYDFDAISDDKVSWNPDPAYIDDEITIMLDTKVSGLMQKLTIPEISDVVLYYKPIEHNQYLNKAMEMEYPDIYSAVIPPVTSYNLDPVYNDLHDYDFYIEVNYVDNSEKNSTKTTINLLSGKPQISGMQIISDAMNTWIYNGASLVKVPFRDEQIRIRINAVDTNPEGEIDSIYVEYGSDVDMEFVADTLFTNIGGDIYQAILPAYDDAIGTYGNYLIQITAVDTSGNYIKTDEIIVDVADRAPVVWNFGRTEPLNNPEPNDTLKFECNVFDTDGIIEDVSLQYTIDYNNSTYSAIMEQVDSNTGNPFVDSTHYEVSLIPKGNNTGNTLHFKIYAADNDGFSSEEYSLNSEEALDVVYPVSTYRAVLKVEPKPFNPYDGETFDINYFVKQGSKVIINIYNAEGKFIQTLVDRVVTETDGHFTYEWDGKYSHQKILPIGLYICHLEVTDQNKGNKKTETVPIVIGRPL